MPASCSSVLSDLQRSAEFARRCILHCSPYSGIGRAIRGSPGYFHSSGSSPSRHGLAFRRATRPAPTCRLKVFAENGSAALHLPARFPPCLLLFLPSHLLHFLTSHLLTFFTSCLLTFLPSSLLDFSPSYLLHFLSSCLLVFLSSWLLGFFPSYLLSSTSITCAEHEMHGSYARTSISSLSRTASTGSPRILGAMAARSALMFARF